MTDYEAALAAQRHRVLSAEDSANTRLYNFEYETPFTRALDDALRLARAIGAAEERGHLHTSLCAANCPVHQEVEAIIAELDTVK